jgi:hypothetical protein
MRPRAVHVKRIFSLGQPASAAATDHQTPHRLVRHAAAWDVSLGRETRRTGVVARAAGAVLSAIFRLATGSEIACRASSSDFCIGASAREIGASWRPALGFSFEAVNTRSAARTRPDSSITPAWGFARSVQDLLIPGVHTCPPMIPSSVPANEVDES